jgi:hypothetical protein
VDRRETGTLSAARAILARALLQEHLGNRARCVAQELDAQVGPLEVENGL